MLEHNGITARHGLQVQQWSHRVKTELQTFCPPMILQFHAWLISVVRWRWVKTNLLHASHTCNYVEYTILNKECLCYGFMHLLQIVHHYFWMYSFLQKRINNKSLCLLMLEVASYSSCLFSLMGELLSLVFIYVYFLLSCSPWGAIDFIPKHRLHTHTKYTVGYPVLPCPSSPYKSHITRVLPNSTFLGMDPTLVMNGYVEWTLLKIIASEEKGVIESGGSL